MRFPGGKLCLILGESIEHRFLRLFTEVTHEQMECPVCRENNTVDFKKWSSQDQIARYPRAFIIGLNRVYYDDTLRTPRRRIDDSKVIVDQNIEIPQLDANLPPVLYRLYATTQHFGQVN